MPTRKRKIKSRNITTFNSPTFGLCDAEFNSDNPDQIIKKALVMVEGTHIDSAKRKHNFPASRVKRIVERTNNWLAKGGRVPWQRDHKKTQDANIGDLEGALEARVITSEDLPDPRLKHLVGRVGAFASNLVGKGKEVVEAITSGQIKTLSPGIDVAEDIIREISATPRPAIPELMTFNWAEFGSGLTMDDALSQKDDEDKVKEDFEDLGETFWNVITCIQMATEEEMQGQEPQDLMMQAVEDYSSYLIELLGLGDSATDPYAQPSDMPAPTAAPLPGYLQKQQGFTKMNRHREVLAAFTMDDMEKLNRAEFFNFSPPSFGQPRRQKKQGSLLGKVAKGAVALGLGAAAVRYGGAGIKAGMKSVQRGIKAGGGTAMGLAGQGISSGFRTAKRRLSTDIGRASKGFSSGFAGVRNTVGSGMQQMGQRISRGGM